MATMAQFSEQLLIWYQSHRRVLPWREETDPYRIWLSEVMLQQTQVKTVIPYYHRWLQKFPTLESVALSSLDEVLKVWEGMGYYSRCRNFFKACQIVKREYEGRIPSSWFEFRQLPGVGDYTAAAVLSFAFDKPYPVLDGNVNRVMARLLVFPDNPSKGKKLFIQKLNEWMNPEKPSEFNHAMMDLGSLVCRKHQPRCIPPGNGTESTETCPINEFCKGYFQGNPELFPVRPEKKPRPHRTIVAGVIWNGDRFLIHRRPENGLLGGLWEFPGGKVRRGESLKKALVREIKEETRLQVTVQKPVGIIDHAYSHFSITLHVFHTSLMGGQEEKSTPDDCKWIAPGDLEKFPFPTANHKIFSILNEEGWRH